MEVFMKILVVLVATLLSQVAFAQSATDYCELYLNGNANEYKVVKSDLNGKFASITLENIKAEDLAQTLSSCNFKIMVTVLPDGTSFGSNGDLME